MSEQATMTPSVTPTMGLVQFDHGGETVKYYNNSASELSAGTPIIQGVLFGVPTRPILPYSWGALNIEGSMVFPKAANDSSLTAGANAYWDDTNKVASSTASANTYIGKVEYGMGTNGTPGAIATADTVVWIQVEAAANASATPTTSGTISVDGVQADASTLPIVGLNGTQGGTVSATAGNSSTAANAGGAASLVGGVGGATGNGGAAVVTGGTPGVTSGTGGAATVTGGGSAAGTNYTGGAATVTGGAGKGTGAGGAAGLVGGAGGTTGAGGAIAVTGGASAGAGGTAGAVTIDAGAATGGSSAAVGIGATNASAVNLGAATIPTNALGALVVTKNLEVSVDTSKTATASTYTALTAGKDITPLVGITGQTAYGWILPTGVAGMKLELINTTAFAGVLAPATGGTIDGHAPNAAVVIAASKRYTLVCTAADTWFSKESAAATAA